jgi:hypothetical protein
MANYTNPTIDQKNAAKYVFYVDTRCAIFTCHGSPEGVIQADTGSLALSDDGNIYKKTTDNITTGWINLSGDSGGGATQALDNLAAVAVNQSLVPGVDDSIDLGTALLRWRDLFLIGFIRLAVGETDTYTTPELNTVPTKINVLNYDPGNFGQILAMGIGNVGTNRRVMSLFDDRLVAHQPTIAIFSPDENNLIGFSWDGSNVIGYIKNTTGNVGIQGRVFEGAPNTAPTDADIPNSFVSMWLNEGTNLLTFRVRYSDGTLKTGTVTLT